MSKIDIFFNEISYELGHYISNNVVCVTSNASDQPAHRRSLNDQNLCWGLEYSMTLRLLTEHYLEFLSLKGGCTGSSKCTHVKMPHCWKSHVTAHINSLMIDTIHISSL